VTQPSYAVIDLSRPIHTKMPVFPAISKTFLGVYLGHKDSLRPGNISSQTNILVMCDHAGTHIDSPLHFNPEGTGIDKMPVDNMVGNAVVQDYSHKKNAETITASEIEENLKKIGADPRDLKFILFRTGAAEYYETDEYLSKYLEVPVAAVEWMLDRGILVFGVDASTVDHAKDRATHMLMRRRVCYHIENMANLDKLPADRVFTFICNPLLMLNSSAAPFRALALVPRT
jgi:kynurenine formamidase